MPWRNELRRLADEVAERLQGLAGRLDETGLTGREGIAQVWVRSVRGARCSGWTLRMSTEATVAHGHEELALLQSRLDDLATSGIAAVDGPLRGASRRSRRRRRSDLGGKSSAGSRTRSARVSWYGLTGRLDETADSREIEALTPGLAPAALERLAADAGAWAAVDHGHEGSLPWRRGSKGFPRPVTTSRGSPSVSGDGADRRAMPKRGRCSPHARVTS